MVESISTDLIQAILLASDDQKQSAMRLLRGEQRPEPKPAPEKFKTLKETATALGFHSATLWRWGVPGHSLGGRRRFLLSEVRAYLDSAEFQQVAAKLKLTRKELRHSKEICHE